MNPNNEVMPPPTASSQRSRRLGQSDRHADGSEAGRAEPTARFQYWARANSIKELDCEPVNFADLLKEELSYRAQARRFLWEFFD